MLDLGVGVDSMRPWLDEKLVQCLVVILSTSDHTLHVSMCASPSATLPEPVAVLVGSLPSHVLVMFRFTLKVGP